jgi:trigger factor
MDFKVTSEPIENRQLAIKIEVAKARVDAELRKAASKLAGKYKLPGFRQGKAPYHIVVQQMGLANVYNEFTEELGQEAFAKALEETGVRP